MSETLIDSASTILIVDNVPDNLAVAVDYPNLQLYPSGIRYRALFETAQDGILLLNSESGRVTDVNASVVQIAAIIVSTGNSVRFFPSRRLQPAGTASPRCKPRRQSPLSIGRSRLRTNRSST